MNPLDQIPVYRPYGEPATGTVTIKSVPTAGDTVTINGTVYTYGTDFTGTIPARVAQSLTAAIRSDVTTSNLNVGKIPIRTHSAVYYNNVVFVFATSPGTAGNAYGLVVSNTSAMAVSAATLLGGTTLAVLKAVVATTAAFATINTSGGATYVLLGSAAATQVTIVNNTGTELLVQRGGAGTALPLPDGFSKTYIVTANASELGVKRTDGGIAVPVYYEVMS